MVTQLMKLEGKNMLIVVGWNSEGIIVQKLPVIGESDFC